MRIAPPRTIHSAFPSAFLPPAESIGRAPTPRMVSLSAGILLGAAILHLLPEAFESQADLHALSWTLLGGLVAFFLLERSSVLRHSHHHEGDDPHHHHHRKENPNEPSIGPG